MSGYQPQHLSAGPWDLAGNSGLGRYIFLTGSDARAEQISKHFKDLQVHTHPRHHNLYLGQIQSDQGWMDVASISSGMGGSSADIILNELFLLGAKRILRIGTAGSLQPQRIHVGDIVIATGAVRDDKTSWDYIYQEFPAVASLEYIEAAEKAIAHIPLLNKIHIGLVHSKSSLFARELSMTLMPENDSYMKNLHLAGVLATEMECAQVFILTALINARLHENASTIDSMNTALSGALLTIIGDETPFSDEVDLIQEAIENTILLGFETTRQLFYQDLKMLPKF